MEKCKNELIRIGRITHMVQDFYCHALPLEELTALGTRKYPFFHLCPFGMIPSSYDINQSFFLSLFSNGEHGGLLFDEPGERAPDVNYRKRSSVVWTTVIFFDLLPKWNKKCKACIRKM